MRCGRLCRPSVGVQTPFPLPCPIATSGNVRQLEKGKKFVNKRKRRPELAGKGVLIVDNTEASVRAYLIMSILSRA